MICTKCGSNNPPGAKFCAKCGNPLEQENTQNLNNTFNNVQNNFNQNQNVKNINQNKPLNKKKKGVKAKLIAIPIIIILIVVAAFSMLMLRNTPQNTLKKFFGEVNKVKTTAELKTLLDKYSIPANADSDYTTEIIDDIESMDVKGKDEEKLLKLIFYFKDLKIEDVEKDGDIATISCEFNTRAYSNIVDKLSDEDFDSIGPVIDKFLDEKDTTPMNLSFTLEKEDRKWKIKGADLFLSTMTSSALSAVDYFV